MLDIEIFKMLRAVIPPLLAARTGQTALELVQSYQPEQQGAPSADTITAAQVGTSKRFGWPQRVAKWDAATQQMRDHTQQAMETTIQLTMVARGSTDPNAPTEVDKCQMVADVVQSDEFMAAIRPFAQVLRVSDVRMGRFKSDNGQNANWPNFDLVIKHTREYVGTTPVVSEWDGLYTFPVV